MKKLLIKHKDQLRELIIYGICGGLTTLVNLGLFRLLYMTPMGVYWATSVAFTASVLFAYVVNTKFVFKAPFTWKNFFQFTAMRLLSLPVDIGGLALFMAMGMGEMLAKTLISVVIIIANYLISKLIIYRKGK